MIGRDRFRSARKAVQFALHKPDNVIGFGFGMLAKNSLNLFHIITTMLLVQSSSDPAPRFITDACTGKILKFD